MLSANISVQSKNKNWVTQFSALSWKPKSAWGSCLTLPIDRSGLASTGPRMQHAPNGGFHTEAPKAPTPYHRAAASDSNKSQWVASPNKTGCFEPIPICQMNELFTVNEGEYSHCESGACILWIMKHFTAGNGMVKQLHRKLCRLVFLLSKYKHAGFVWTDLLNMGQQPLWVWTG